MIAINTKKYPSAAVVLCSGGLDSTVLLHYVVKKLKRSPVYPLFFSYGQRHSRELEMAQYQVSSLSDVENLHVADLHFFAKMTSSASALFKDGAEVPDLADLSEEELQQPPTYVPNRNMILLALGAARAEAVDADTVFYGAQSQDEYGYWDCTEEFVLHMNRVLSLNRRNPVQIEAPFVSMRKSEEVKLGQELNVNFAFTWSCYRGGEKPCGACPTCVERATAFREAGLQDPLVGTSGQ